MVAPTIEYFKESFNSGYDDVRENASRYLFNLYQANYDFTPELLAFVISKLGDESQNVRRNVARFILLMVQSNRNLGTAWLNVAEFLRSEDPIVRQTLIMAFGKLNQGETLLKKLLEDPRLSPRTRFYAAEGLAHYYDNAKYLSSLATNLRIENPEIVKGTLVALRIDNSLGILKKTELENLKPAISAANTFISKPKAKELPIMKPREVPRELRDKRNFARA